jgi:SAM-dependent methyltransferase
MTSVARWKSRATAVETHSDLLWYLDEPAKGEVVASGWRLVRGWVAVPRTGDLDGPTLCVGAERISPGPESRPDVEALHPDWRVVGFREFVRLPDADPDLECSLEVTVHGRQHRRVLPFSVGADRSVQSADLPFRWYLDSPRGGPEPTDHSVLVRGWIVVPRAAQLEGVFVDHGPRAALPREDRPDLETQYPADQVVGFRGLVSVSPATTDAPWAVGVTLDGHDYRAPLPVAVKTDDRDEFFRRKAAKLEKVEHILRCPRPLDDRSSRRACGGKLERVGASALSCVECAQQYPVTDRGFNLLSGELRDISGIADTSNVSSLPYGEWELPALIDEYADGLILDNGSGLRDVYYENVVNFEIVDYLTTDVLGVGEYLPFADDAFDAVISIAVLEHVRNPFDSAAEIARVVRPGGKILVEVPFLQPYHGYPHHYYNMTISGLENLFSEHFVIERSGLPPGGEPIWTLPWLLNAYVAGLPTEAAEHFKQLTVRDLLAEGSTFLGEDFVRDLGERTAEDLAHVTYLIGTKKR